MEPAPVVGRGEIWWAKLPAPGYSRPVVIAQSNSFNQSRIGTVLVVPLTSSRWLADAPGNVLLRRSETGLSKDSVANVSQVGPVDRERLVKRMGELSPRLLGQVEMGLRRVLAL